MTCQYSQYYLSLLSELITCFLIFLKGFLLYGFFYRFAIQTHKNELKSVFFSAANIPTIPLFMFRLSSRSWLLNHEIYYKKSNVFITSNLRAFSSVLKPSTSSRQKKTPTVLYSVGESMLY